MLPRTTERRLIRRAKDGDGDAVEALIRAHQQSLYAFILRLSGKPEVAEDIVQEAFVRVLKNLDRFDSRYRFSTWVFTIAKRLYVNAMQKLKPAYDSEVVGLQQGTGTTPGRESAISESQDNAKLLLEHVLVQLNAQQREIVLLFHQLNWSITEISDHLDMPEGTVKSHLHRARRRMRKLIESNEQMARHAEEIWR